MGFLDSLFGGTTSKTTTGTTQTSLPGWVNQGSERLIGRSTDLAFRPVTNYTGEMAAGLTPDQQAAFSKLKDIVGNVPNMTGTAISGALGYASAPGQNVSTDRVVDQGGQLGSISDYINPYVQASLDPTLRQIQEQSDKQRKQIGAQATSAGAFGDARQGILEGTLGRDTSMAMGEATGKAYSDAFNAAMQNRQTDAARQLQTALANAGFNEQQIQRLLTGTQGALTAAGTGQQQALTGNQALQSAGATQQQTQQNIDTAAYQEFLRQQGWDYNTIQALTSAMKASPYETGTSTTSTTTQPNNVGSSLLGSVAGSAANNVLDPTLSAAGTALLGLL